MQALGREQFTELVAAVKPRLRRDLRFSPEVVGGWDDIELLALANRAGNAGILLAELNDSMYVLPYELRRKLADKSGRSRPITCDFCYTWQRGSKAARITFTRTVDQHTFTFLCCGDLWCSRHVRDQTPAAHLSRTQLHEDLTTPQRIARLHAKLQKVVELLAVAPINVRHKKRENL